HRTPRPPTARTRTHRPRAHGPPRRPPGAHPFHRPPARPALDSRHLLHRPLRHRLPHQVCRSLMGKHAHLAHGRPAQRPSAPPHRRRPAHGRIPLPHHLHPRARRA